jgi:VWFA-related protein
MKDLSLHPEASTVSCAWPQPCHKVTRLNLEGQQRHRRLSQMLTISATALALVILSTTTAHAQQIGQNSVAKSGDTFTLSVKSQLVVETVTVKDKDGKPVQGLTAKDFTLTEDGAPQTIKFCEHEVLPTAIAPIAPGKSNENIKIYKKLARTQIQGETETAPKYDNKRLLAMYFDMSAMRPSDQLRALTAAEKFVRTQMTDADLVSVMRYTGGAVDVLQDFTADKNRLLSILQTMIVGEGQNDIESAEDSSAVDVGAAFGQDDSEFNVFNTDRQLSALQTTAKMLGQLNEKKALLYFASGLRLNGVDNQAQLHATVDAAIRAGVAFWPIDARGLVAGAPLGDATQGSPGNQGMYSGTAAQAVTDRFQQSQDTLFALAGDTGGKALFDTNDLTQGIVKAQQAISDYYIIGYYTSNNEQNGRFRKVKLTLGAEYAGAKLDYRQGYYADKVFAKFNATDKERQLEDALMLADPVTDLTIAMEIDYFQLNRAEYFVPIIVKIPGRELALAKKGGAEHTLIDFVGEIKDVVGGTTVTNVRDNVNIKLSDATASELAKRPVEYDAGFTLLPGKYEIKILARDDETGRIGTYQTTFVIPNLNKVIERVPISSVVLSSQRVPLAETLYDANKKKDQAKDAAADPLVTSGGKLIPSVTRVFGTDREMYVYLQGYEPGTAATDPILGYVSFYRDGSKVFETKPEALTPVAGSRLGMVPLNFTVVPSGLKPGEYQCQVTVLDPTRGRATYWQAPIMLVP